jgi:hypothetical protein
MAGPRIAGAFFIPPGRNVNLACHVMTKMHHAG